MITKRYVTTITLNKKEVLNRVADCTVDILNDYTDSPDDFLINFEELKNVLNSIHERKAKEAFLNGFTSIILTDEQFREVETFFNIKRNNPQRTDTIEVVIIDENGDKDVVPMDYIQY